MSLTIYLYEEPACPTLNISELVSYLKSLFPFKVQGRGNFLDSIPKEKLDDLALGFALSKVRDPLKKIEAKPLPIEIEYEKRRLSSRFPSFGIVYDGYKVARLLTEFLSPQERRLSCLHLIFTNQLLATWEDRYHLRVAIFSFPCLISTTGVVEAPAKQPEYYLLKQQYLSLGLTANLDLLEEGLKDKSLVHQDPRITEVMKGYLMQAVFYHLFGEPFCEDKGCRFYNAHRQEELIYAQLQSSYQFCPQHIQKIKELNLSFRKYHSDLPSIPLKGEI